MKSELTKSLSLMAMCSAIILMVPSVSQADSEYMAQRAHQTCLEYGAKPGTRLFYRCMKSQMRKEQYNNASAACSGPQEQSRIQNQCIQSVAPVGNPNPWQEVADCRMRLTAQCNQQASDEYLHRNNAQKYDLNIHSYNHTYNGN